jgi:hypothetical protein
MSWIGPAIAAGGALLGGLTSAIGGKDAANINRGSAAEVTEANIRESQRITAFQERMSNTAHQREVEDLKAAGLNPILALKSGASTPGGSAGSGVAATVQNQLEGLATSVMEATRIAQEIKKSKKEVENLGKIGKNLEAQTKRTNMETKVMSKGIPQAEIKNDMYDIIKPYIKKMKQSVQPSVPRGMR